MRLARLLTHRLRSLFRLDRIEQLTRQHGAGRYLAGVIRTVTTGANFLFLQLE